MYRIILFLVLLTTSLVGRAPDLTPEIVRKKLEEIVRAHAMHQEINDTIAKRAIQNYLEELDPNKTYLIKEDIVDWLEPDDDSLQILVEAYRNGDYSIHEKLYEIMIEAVRRKQKMVVTMDLEDLPKDVKATEFKDMQWAENIEELKERTKRIRALQVETASKMNEELKERSLMRLDKRQQKFESDYLELEGNDRERAMLAKIMKATASALDSHTAYFTPDEATQFMISVQQRLFGIGAQLRDDLNGFTVVKVIEGGPAAEEGKLKPKDRIIAVDGEPVVGMDIIDAVELIRGEKGTKVTLTIIRPSEEDEREEEKLEIDLVRDEVILKETRLETSVEPFGDGVIGYLRLFSFYQDQEFSSAKDMTEEINRMKKEYNLKGLILDLRYNSGGLLSQAVDVAGLFISKGVVVSIRDNQNLIQRLRNFDGSIVYDGPLVVLVNRASASAAEIVAQTLQDYGRALVVGDDHTFGKGSFQTFTLNTTNDSEVNPRGEYKVTRGMYFTVSGKSPQLTGVLSDVVIPGPLSESEIGEKYGKFPLENDRIESSFVDDLSDVPLLQRARVKALYLFNIQEPEDSYSQYIEILQNNAEKRIETNKNYQNLLAEIRKNKNGVEDEEEGKYGENDLQLQEALNVIKDLIYLKQIESMQKEAA